MVISKEKCIWQCICTCSICDRRWMLNNRTIKHSNTGSIIIRSRYRCEICTPIKVSIWTRGRTRYKFDVKIWRTSNVHICVRVYDKSDIKCTHMCQVGSQMYTYVSKCMINRTSNVTYVYIWHPTWHICVHLMSELS